MSKEHLPLLDTRFRTATNSDTGIVAAHDVIRIHQEKFFPSLSVNSLWLGNQWPLYEVIMNGTVYRMLIRENTHSKIGYEIFRVVAPGPISDGHVLEPAPATVPNTPMALIEEIAYVTGRAPEYVAERAYSLSDYRKYHVESKPSQEKFERFRFDQWFMLKCDSGIVSSYFDTPSGVNPELWTIFLKIVETQPPNRIMDYIVSGAAREFGERTAAHMMNLMRFKHGYSYSPRVNQSTNLLGAFPFSLDRLERTGPTATIVSRVDSQVRAILL